MHAYEIVLMENTIGRSPLQVQVYVCMCVHINFLQQQGAQTESDALRQRCHKKWAHPNQICLSERMNGREKGVIKG